MTGKPLGAIALAALLAGCGSSPGGSSDDTLSRILVAPDKYVLFTCPEIIERARLTVERQRELERLMAKASVDSGGRLISTMAYRPEYLEKRGELNELRNAAIAKNCKTVPGSDTAGVRASDGALR